MRSRLAPVSLLLLLALSSAGIHAEAPGEDAFGKALFGSIPNTALLTVIPEGDLPPKSKDAIINGALCEDDALTKAKAAGGLDIRDVILKAIKPEADCEKKTTDYEKCACDATKLPGECIVIMAASKTKGVTKKACISATRKAVEEAGFKAFGKGLSKDKLEAATKNVDTSDIADFWKTMNGDATAMDKLATVEAGKMLCDATDDAVGTKVKEMFESDGAVAFIEFTLSMRLFNISPDQLGALCKSEMKEHEVGKCFCEQDKGVVYCLLNAIGKHFKQDGYLKCPASGDPTFDAAKKPTATPQALPQVSFTTAAPAAEDPTTTAASGSPAPSAAAAALAAVLALLL